MKLCHSYKQIEAYPGEQIRLVITPYNEMNCITAATFQISDTTSSVSIIFCHYINHTLRNENNNFKIHSAA